MKSLGTFEHNEHTYEVFREIVSETVFFIVNQDGKEVKKTPVPFIEYCNNADLNDINAKDPYYFELEKSKITSNS